MARDNIKKIVGGGVNDTRTPTFHSYACDHRRDVGLSLVSNLWLIWMYQGV